MWRLIAPSAAGPQPYGTGGQVVVHISHNEGATWRQEHVFPCPDGRNHTYVRRPLNAHPDFYALWADGYRGAITLVAVLLHARW